MGFPLDTMFGDILVIVGAPALVILLPEAWRARDRATLLRIAEKAVEAGRPLPPELFQALSTRPLSPTPAEDVRRGFQLMGIGLGIVLLAFCVFMIFVSQEERRGGVTAGSVVAAFGVIPLCLGAGRLVAGLLLGGRVR